MPDFRTEHDSMGDVRVPAKAYYGAQTQRAVENFPISGWPLPPELIHALGLVKYAAAVANRDLGKLTGHGQKSAESQAGRRPARRPAAKWPTASSTVEFPIDVFQTGSGTSSNMNANEVIANRAIEILGGDRFARSQADPSQRSREHGAEHQRHVPHGDSRGRGAGDQERFDPRAGTAAQTCWPKKPASGTRSSRSAARIWPTPRRSAGPGNRRLRPAAGAVDRTRRQCASRPCSNLPAGGTAVGTGINTHPEFGRRVAAVLAKETGIPFVEAANHFEANAQRDGLVECSGDIAHDRRHAVQRRQQHPLARSSGPRCGFYEIKLPDRQPGSSIMPGKVNPVMCESMMQVCARVMGNDQTIAFSGATGGQFQLNIMMPVMGHGRAGKHYPAGQRHAGLRRFLRRRNGSQRRSLRGLRRKKPVDGHQPQSATSATKRPPRWPKKPSRPAKRSANFAANKRFCRTTCSTRPSIRGA